MDPSNLNPCLVGSLGPDQSKPLDSPAILPPPSLFGGRAGLPLPSASSEQSRGAWWVGVAGGMTQPSEAAGDPLDLLQLKAENWRPSENEERLFPSGGTLKKND